MFATNFRAKQQGRHQSFSTDQLVNRALLNILVGYPSGDILYLYLSQQLSSHFFVLVVHMCILARFLKVCCKNNQLGLSAPSRI
jgi:hypothetical protein